MKTVFVIAGSYWQIPIIQKIKEMGHRVLVVNPYDDSPAFEYADGHLKSDILNIGNCLNYAKEQNIDAVISEECDIAMPVVAAVAEEMNLPSLGHDSAHLFTDKYAMREFCHENGLAYPIYQICETREQAVAFFKQHGLKMIMKPLDCNSSRGVTIIESVCDIEDNFDASLAFSRIRHAVILERYIEGTEFTIDGVKTADGHFKEALNPKYKKQSNALPRGYRTKIRLNVMFPHIYERLRKLKNKRISN